MRLLGIDVGGTFTDVVLADTDCKQVTVHKVATTPEDPSAAVVKGISEICARENVAPSSISHVYHGTTVATNAVLQHRGAKVGMITTRGFRDIVHIGRHQRPQHYSIAQDIPWQSKPLVKRIFRKTVRERLIPPDGDVEIALNEEDVRQATRELRNYGVNSIVVCFLFSYLDSLHEARAKEIVEEEYPSAFVSASHEVSPQYREFERFTTASMNAFIGPLVREYVANLKNELQALGLSAELLVMRSNGGVATPALINALPIYTLMSGLAAGVLSGAWVAQLAERRNVISFDVGGTSADIGVVTEGRYSEASARDTFVGGYPIMVPMIDLHTLGAGGGSIAFLDEGGAFRVGPESAGAVPGPAAYGAGGVQPTVTDANLVLGRLDRTGKLAGGKALDVGAAERAVGNLASGLGLGVMEAAAGIVAIINSNMANAIRVRTVQKGIDPREYALVASGGAGPMHGVEVAQQLGIPEVIIPPYPGISSAMGLLTTDLKYDTLRSILKPATKLDIDKLNQAFVELEDDIKKQFDQDDVYEITFIRMLDARYVGQGYELKIGISNGRIDQATIGKLLNDFHELHRGEYGHNFPKNVVEFVNIRVTATATVPKMPSFPVSSGASLEEATIKTDTVAFRVDGELQIVNTPFLRRDALPVGVSARGPAIILQSDATTVIPPKCSFLADSAGFIVVRTGDS